MRKVFIILFMAVLICGAAFSLAFHALPAYAEGEVNSGNAVNGSADDGGSSTPLSSLNSDMPSGGWNFNDKSKVDGINGKDGGGGGRDGLIEWLEKMVDGILNLPGKIVSTMTDAVFNLWGMMIDSFLNIFCGVLGTAFTHTIYPGSIDWVSHGNIILWIVCVALAILFLTINILHVLHGKKQFKPVLTTFAVGVTLSVFSVQIVNVLVWLANATSSSLAQGMLDTYTTGGMHLDLTTLTGQQVMSIPFQDPASFGGQIPFHSLFLDPVVGTNPQAHGGILALILAAAEWFVMIVLAYARIVILCLGTILAPVYISMTVWSTQIEPAVGWVALMFRTVFVQVIWACGWAAMVFVQVQYSAKNLSNLLGATATAANIIMLGIFIYLTYMFWFKPTALQIAKPVTLAGGVVTEKVGQVGEKVGRAVKFVGMATLQPEVVAAGGAISGVGRTVADRGRDMHGDRSLRDSFDLSEEPPESPSHLKPMDHFSQRIEKRYEKYQEDEIKKIDREEKKKHKKYWKWHGKYIIRDPQSGLPQEIPAPPEGYEYQGEWQG